MWEATKVYFKNKKKEQLSCRTVVSQLEFSQQVEGGSAAFGRGLCSTHSERVEIGQIMTRLDLVGGISWHLECMVLATTAIDNFRPPADGFQMRMHYSLYLTNLMSAIDMVSEEHSTPFREALEDSLKTSNFSGAEVLGYIRELRNGVVHRGIDPTAGGMVVDGLVCAVAPSTVQNRGGARSYAAPAHLLRDIFIHCEIGTKPIVERFLESSFEELESVKPEAMLNDALNAIEEVQHMPDWAKEMARKHIQPEMLVKAQTHQVEKLRGLLRPRAGQRIA